MSAEEFLMKYGICSDTTIGIEGDLKLVDLLERYADERASQASITNAAMGQSEECFLHSTDWNGKCFKCGKQVFVRERKNKPMEKNTYDSTHPGQVKPDKNYG